MELLCWAEARRDREQAAAELRGFLATHANEPLLGCSLDRQVQALLVCEPPGTILCWVALLSDLSRALE